MTSSSSEPVPLTPSLRKRFYEAVILLSCVTAAYIKGRMTELAESEPSAPRSRRQSYFVFVNKLAQICDSKRGGDTVTAFAILQPNDVQYRFASNKRSEGDLKKVKTYITDILNILGKASNEDIRKAILNRQTPIFSVILQKIIKFNRRRLATYIKAIANHSGNCIEGARNETATEGSTETLTEGHEVVDLLEKLAPLAESALRKIEIGGEKVKIDDEQFAEKTEVLMHAIHGGYKGMVEEFVAEHCVQDSRDERTHWDEVHHAFGRLLSYFTSVTVLIRARRYWPKLFEGFKVVSNSSSRPSRDPPSVRKSAEKIIQTLTSRDPTIVDDYNHVAEQLQQWGLDKSIQEITHHTYFKPIVHAEVLVDDSIRRDKRQTQGEPLSFFMEDEFGKYIGASKPTCRLCALYFDSQTDSVKVRPSHNNLYHNWRPADVFVSDSDAVRKERDVALEAMIPKLRDGVGSAIRQRSAPWRRFDSNNTATSPAFTIGTDIVTQLGSLRISGDAETIRGSSPDTVDDYDDSEDEGSEDEEEE